MFRTEARIKRFEPKSLFDLQKHGGLMSATTSTTHQNQNANITGHVKKELPSDLLAEKSLLGCLILDNQSYDQISDLKLTDKDFYHPAYGKVFRAISELLLEINQLTTLPSPPSFQSKEL